MEQGTFVSIIVPVYNVAPYLAEALDSVLGQTHGNLQIIVVDDGSTDGSGEICDEYALRDARVTVVHQRNGGLSAARNAGLDMMTGELVAFLDPDDAYLPTYVEVMLKAMARERADVVACGHATLRTTGRLAYDARQSAEQGVAGVYDGKDALRLMAAGSPSVVAGTSCPGGSSGRASDFQTGTCTRIARQPSS